MHLLVSNSIAGAVNNRSNSITGKVDGLRGGRGMMKQTLEVSPELRVSLDLEAHEKECAIRYKAVEDKLSALDKRLWRLEAMIMGSTVVIVGLAASLLMKI